MRRRHGWNRGQFLGYITSRTLAQTALVGFLALPAWPQQNSTDLTTKSLEDLMNVQVTSVSKNEQTLSRTASAIFVITAEDIARSGAMNIPDLLRMVPGMDVAQINAHTWAISARGFNGEFSNELLVLVDGRTVYVPTFGGVFWDVLDMPLDDIERIEVIRGPGGTIWGANAVNGVVNIITKKAADTHGALIVAGGGTLDQGFGTAQYGGALGKNTDYRVYSKYLDQSQLPAIAGQLGGDSWHLLSGGFRIDSTLSPRDTLDVQGSFYRGNEGNPSRILASVTSPGLEEVDPKVDLSGGYLQLAWNHTFSARSDTTLQISYDSFGRNDTLAENRYTLNLDFQHHIEWGQRQIIIWGLDYRYSSSQTHGSLIISLNPADLTTQIAGSFVQDEIALSPDRLYLTIGTKLEHDYYTGFVLLPSARIAWQPNNHLMFWAAVSRAARTPASLDISERLNFAGFPGANGVPVLIGQVGNPHFKNEDLTAYEAGIRNTILKRLSIDFAAFYGDYTHQETAEPAPPVFETAPAPPHLFIPTVFENLLHGESHGLEVAANWKVTDRWTLSPGYAFEQIHMHLDPSSQDTTSVSPAQGSSPVNSGQLRSHFIFPHNMSWDTSAYFVGRLNDPKIPSYTRVDTGLTWHYREGLSISVVGQNLVRDHHLEFIEPTGATVSTLIKRSAYAKVTWRF
ncbi:MAG: TonB-dependent receptor [Candidatus Acidiferrales bacterium]